MHQDLNVIATIAMAVLTALIGGFLARKARLPTLIGYLVAGLIIGPFTPGFVASVDTANQLAEMGVIFMMFGVGLHFSLRDLWNVRRIAIPGAVLQTTLTTLAGLGLSQLWGWSVSAGLVLGLSLSIASTVVLLRALTDNGLLNSSHGRVAVGWLVFEDLATILILVLLPVLVNQSGNPLQSIGLALLKTVIFVAIMIVIGTRVLSWLLDQIAHLRSRELFILGVVALALGSAYLAYELFAVSMALGAFVAGVVVGESRVHTQVSADIIPFRDFFAVLFFVSVGMLVDPAVVLANLGQVLLLTLLIVVGKAILTLALAFVLPGPARTFIVVAAGLSQIGEFSFIVGATGLELGLISADQYGLILAGAVLSIVVNPLMFRAIPLVEERLRRIPALWKRMDRGGPVPLPLSETMRGHVVIVGYGRVGRHIGRVLRQLNLPFLVVERDIAAAAEMQAGGLPTLLGDAANSEILTHAGLTEAKVLVVTVPDQTAAELIVAGARDICPDIPIIARAAVEERLPQLIDLGANQAIHPELEGGLEIVRHMLLALGYTASQIQTYVDSVRSDAYEGVQPGGQEYAVLDQFVAATRGMQIAWEPVRDDSPVIGLSLAEANLRSRTGASVVALVRGEQVIPNPKSHERFLPGDVVGLIGSQEELAGAWELLSSKAQAMMERELSYSSDSRSPT